MPHFISNFKMILLCVQLEEKVREWQESASSNHSSWINDQLTWVDLVSSALRFMSGDVVGKELIA